MFRIFKCKWSPNVCCSAALVISLFSMKSIVPVVQIGNAIFFPYCAVLLLDFNKEKEILCYYKQCTDDVNLIVIQSCAFTSTHWYVQLNWKKTFQCFCLNSQI